LIAIPNVDFYIIFWLVKPEKLSTEEKRQYMEYGKSADVSLEQSQIKIFHNIDCKNDIEENLINKKLLVGFLPQFHSEKIYVFFYKATRNLQNDIFCIRDKVSKYIISNTITPSIKKNLYHFAI
jgi:hypothetical protein